jgi:hypothetical protein
MWARIPAVRLPIALLQTESVTGMYRWSGLGWDLCLTLPSPPTSSPQMNRHTGIREEEGAEARA